MARKTYSGVSRHWVFALGRNGRLALEESGQRGQGRSNKDDEMVGEIPCKNIKFLTKKQFYGNFSLV
jgi:hypothetical protein